MPWTPADIVPQTGKIALVTGGNSGIGWDTCEMLAGAGAKVILAARNAERGEAAVARIRAKHPDAEVSFAQIDLDSLASIRAFAERMNREHERIDLLINNAGLITMRGRELSADGYERMLAVNFLGHFALTAQLMPLLLASEAPRVVQLGSLAHRRGSIAFEDLQGEESFAFQERYAQSKLACVIFGVELGRRAQASGSRLMSVVAHPGWATTSIFLSGSGGSLLGRVITRLMPLGTQTSHAGALPTVYAATAPEVTQGGYYGPGGKGEKSGPPGPSEIYPQARDRAVAAKLWDEAERLTGVRLELPGQ